MESLLNQTTVIPIFLSISFESDLVFEIFKKMLGIKSLLNNVNITIYYRETKTSQFRHIFNVFDTIKNDFDYFMFCDDDDTYLNYRVKNFMDSIEYTLNTFDLTNKIFVGLYESKNSESHSKSYLEYWNYCINKKNMEDLITKIRDGGFDKFIDHVYFDMMFGSYFRFLDKRHIFTMIPIKMYNYNKYPTSVLGNIQTKNLKYKQPEYSTTNLDTIVKCNNYIRERLCDIKIIMFLNISRGFNYNEICAILDGFPLKDENFVSLLDKDLIQELHNYYIEVKLMASCLGIKHQPFVL